MDFSSMHHQSYQGRGRGKQTVAQNANERLLIKGGNIVNHDSTFQADVYIENGFIKQIGTDLIVPGGGITIDAQGAKVIPGGIDVFTNFDSCPYYDDDENNISIRCADDFYSGTRAALIGGTTTIVDCATGDDGSLMSAYKERSETSSTSCCDVSFHVDVTAWNEEVKQDMTMLAKDKKVNSFRVFMSDRWQMTDEQLYEILEHVKFLGGIAVVHAENGSLIRRKSHTLRGKYYTMPDALLKSRSEDMEFEAVNRAIVIAKEVKCPIFFPCITGEKALNAITEARGRGLPIYAQVLSVALHRDGSSYHDPSWAQAASCVTWPPLRDNPDAKQRLLQGLTSGNIQCVSSGHCVYTNFHKSAIGRNDFAKIPPGTNGVYERMMALWKNAVDTGCIDANQFVALTSTNAAKLFNLFPSKGHVAVGSIADLVIWRDSESKFLTASAVALNVTKPDCINVFENLEVHCGPSVVICRGKVVCDENQVTVVQSMGTLLQRTPFAPHVYSRLQIRDKNDTVVPSSPTVLHRKQNKSKPAEDEQDDKSEKSNNLSNDEVVKPNDKPERFTRKSGLRPMHQSGWSFSGEENVCKRKVGRHPPGGRSSIVL